MCMYVEHIACMYVTVYNEGSSLLSIHPYKFSKIGIIITLKFKLYMRFLNKYEHVAFRSTFASAKCQAFSRNIFVIVQRRRANINYMILKKYKTFS